jgi:hypothetical protein
VIFELAIETAPCGCDKKDRAGNAEK